MDRWSIWHCNAQERRVKRSKSWRTLSLNTDMPRTFYFMSCFLDQTSLCCSLNSVLLMTFMFIRHINLDPLHSIFLHVLLVILTPLFIFLSYHEILIFLWFPATASPSVSRILRRSGLWSLLVTFIPLGFKLPNASSLITYLTNFVTFVLHHSASSFSS